MYLSVLTVKKFLKISALTTSGVNTGTPVEMQGLQKIEDLSLDSSKVTDVTSSLESQVDKSNRHSAPLPNTWRNSLSDLGVDTDKLPKPVMPKSNVDNDLKKTPKIVSCENSFDEDLEDIKSLPDSLPSEKESQA